MLQTHCDVAWSQIVLGYGSFSDGNLLGTTLGWASCCYSGTTGTTNSCPPISTSSPYYTNYPEFCYEQVPGSGIYYHQQPGMYYHNHPDGDCCTTTMSATPQSGQYYCNNSPSQGNSCVKLVSSGGGSNGFIPGQPTSYNVANVSLSWGPFYDTLQDCEATCSNHYPFNCWDYNNGNTSPHVSFPYLTTLEKNDFCVLCQNDVPGSMIKSHPYCWCLDNVTSSASTVISPPAGMWSLPSNNYSC